MTIARVEKAMKSGSQKMTARFTNAEIARVAHEVNKAYCEALGDFSQPTWGKAPIWQIDSALAGVEFHRKNPEAGPESSHNSWMEQKAEDGWKYGPEKDPDKREHPCFVLFDDLPPEQKAKDYLFQQVVHSLAGL